MAARAGAINATMVNDDNGTLERFSDRVCGIEIGRHVLVARFRATKAAIESVEHHQNGSRVLLLNGGNQSRVIFHQVHAGQHKQERDFGIGRDVVMLPECGRTSLKALGALEGAIDDGSGNDTATAILPAQRAMHREIEGPKTFAALRRTPDGGDSNSWN